MTVFTTVGGATARAGGGQRRASLETLQRRSAAAEAREDEIRAVLAIEQSLLTLHHEEFQVATRPILPQPARPDVDALIEARKQQALQGVSFFDRDARRQATQWAQDTGRRDAEQQWQQALAQHTEQQQTLTEHWNKLIAHDADVVHDVLEDAFEDNQSPAACLEVGKDLSSAAGIRFATVLILFGPVDQIPERQPAVTATGQPTLRKRTKTDRNDFYVKALGATVLATVKEGFAVAPSVNEFRIVVLRKDPQASNPATYVEWIYAARFPRQWTVSLPWQSLDPGELLLQAPDAQLRRQGAAGNVVGLALHDEPGMAEIVEQVRAAL
ncbi:MULTISPECIES: hypothetical protein [Mycolicibacterium]|uniref:hypothetical protein n=1 Tax=Mycolicibacterium TaxID=1866885 RepID=UPI001CDC3440|nr:hypothetical protein [Mycolicibacterium fortuitum]UBV20361.1 hypothetical protein H8Z59_24265 [Mycolicibacterium fortuitum]